MAYDNRDSIDFGQGEIHRLFNKMFVPTLLGMLFNLAFILTDGIFVGHGVGPDGLAAVNLVGPIMMLMTGLGMMFGTGSSVVAAIHLSKGNQRAARINVTQAFITASVLALLLSVILYLAPDRILRLLGTSEELLPITSEYLKWFIPTCILLIIQIVGEFVIRLDGSPKYAMFANIIPAGLNIILDYVFIFICHWGLMGAAFATSVGTGVGAGMTLYYMFARSRDLRFYHLKASATSLRLSLRNVSYIVKVGFTGFMGELAGSMTTLCGNLAIGKILGDTGLAAFSVICYICPVVFNVFYAVTSAAQPIISFNHGAGRTERVKGTFKYSLSICLGFGALITVLFWIADRSLISVFLKPGSDAFIIASKGLRLYSLCLVLIAFNMSVIGYFQAIEKSLAAILLMSLRGFVLIIVFFAVMPAIFGENGLWTAVTAGETLTAAVSATLLWQLTRHDCRA